MLQLRAPVLAVQDAHHDDHEDDHGEENTDANVKEIIACGDWA